MFNFSSSIDELRELALENLTKLEEQGLVSKSDDYQTIISQIASVSTIERTILDM